MEMIHVLGFGFQDETCALVVDVMGFAFVSDMHLLNSKQDQLSSMQSVIEEIQEAVD